MRALFALAFIALSPGSAAARDYHVSTAGSDAGRGTAAAPFRTIAKAAAAMKPGDTCIVGKGLYFETVRPPSGTEGKPITFRAAKAREATVCGTMPVTGWTKLADGLYKADVKLALGRNNQVFFDGRPANEARWPNSTDDDLLTPEAAGFRTGGANTIVCKAFPTNWSAKDLDGAVAWPPAASAVCSPPPWAPRPTCRAKASADYS